MHEVSQWQKTKGNCNRVLKRAAPCRSFTQEFKHEAVRLAIERGNV